MRLISLSDYEVGVIAIGAMPVGIVAIGGAPLGVVAIGVLPHGGLTLAVGAGVGVVSISCGVAVGVWARAVGLAFGFRVAKDSPAAGFSVLPGDYPAAPEEPAPRPTLELDRLTPGEPGWVQVRVESASRRVLRHRDATLSVSAASNVQVQLDALEGQEVAALLRADEPLDDVSSGAGYRVAPKKKEREYECLELEARARAPRGRRKQVVWWAQAAVRFVPFALIMVLAFVLGREQILDTTMTRQAEITWRARPISSEGIYLVNDAACAVKAWLRSDGAGRLAADVEITCGNVMLYERASAECWIDERLDGPGRFVHRLRCARDGEVETDDHAGRALLEVDTTKRQGRLTMQPPRPLHIELEVEELSRPRGGVALYEAHDRP